MVAVVSYQYASFAEIEGLLNAPRKCPYENSHAIWGANIYIGDYIKCHSVAVTNNGMQVAETSAKKSMSHFSVPVTGGAVVSFPKRLDSNMSDVGLDVEVVG
jgi:hypothetical protein